MAHLLKDLSMDFTDTDALLRQVIVNTHSPVLVGELIQWKDDSNVSVWLSRLDSLIAEIEGKKTKIKITKMSPVFKENKKQNRPQLTIFPVSEPERKLTLSGQIEHWAKIGKCVEENPDLTYSLIKELLIGVEELEQGERPEYKFGQ